MAKNETSHYVPPFRITDEIASLVIAIGEIVGHLLATADKLPTPQLRKQNRIKTIQSSLAIENNSLSVEQVTDIVDGKRVLGPPNEIQEVKNAIDAYQLLLELNPFAEKDLLRAHRLMMAGLVKETGHYRSGGVGVFSERGLVHLAPPASQVPTLMGDLFHWIKTTKTHPLISSCVFHYEFEFIHPFADGNGRMGRLWQILLLMRWNSIFAWLPVETIVKERQQEYYDAIAACDKQGESTSFIAFMLRCLLSALAEFKKSNQKSDQKIICAMRQNPAVSISELQGIVGLSESGVKRAIRLLKEKGIIMRVGGAKGGHWLVVEDALDTHPSL